MDLKNKRRQSALLSLMNDAAPILTQDDRIKWATEGVVTEAGELNLSKLEEVVRQIYKGEYKRGGDNFTSVEEIFGDLLKVVNDEDTNKILWSGITRQTNVESLGTVRLTLLDKMMRASEVISPTDDMTFPKIFGEIYSKEFAQSAPIIDNIILTEGGYLASDDLMHPGVFRIQSIGRNKKGEASITLQDVINHKEKTFVGNNYREVSEQMHTFSSVSSDVYGEVTSLRNNLKQQYEKGILESFEINKKVFKEVTGDFIEDAVLEEIQSTYSKERTLDFLTKTKILKNKGYIDDDQISKLQEAMNTHIKQAGSQAKYEEAFYNELSSLDSFKKRNIVNGSQAKKFTKNLFTEENANIVENLEKENIINSRKVIQETTEQIKDETVSKTQEAMNQKIKEQGAKAGKSSESKFYSKATKGLSDAFEKIKNHKGTAIGSAALAALSIGGLWYMGNRKISPDADDSYKPADQQSPLIKSRDNGNNYKNVPTSNSKYYKNQEVGTAMNIVAQAPSNSTGEEMSELVQEVFGREVNINTSYSDSTSEPTRDEVDTMINDFI